MKRMIKLTEHKRRQTSVPECSELFHLCSVNVVIDFCCRVRAVVAIFLQVSLPDMLVINASSQKSTLQHLCVYRRKMLPSMSSIYLVFVLQWRSEIGEILYRDSGDELELYRPFCDLSPRRSRVTMLYCLPTLL